MADDADELARKFRRWARIEAHGSSPSYERLAVAIADDPAAKAILVDLPPAKRQPNLLFAAMRWCAAPVTDVPAALAWLPRHAEQVTAVMRTHRTQTNEPARCALLLPGLARLPEPLALIEVGASAGLCLLPDRWRYHYVGDDVDHYVGLPDSAVTLRCQVSGPVPLPRRIPHIAWRLGLDLNPLDPRRPDDRRWLQALVWPEHAERAVQLAAALDTAAADPPTVRTGDLLRDLPALLAEVPDGLTAVVIHTSTLVYVDQPIRDGFTALLRDAGVYRLGAEPSAVLSHLTAPPGTAGTAAVVVSCDDDVLAVGHPHGRELQWL